MGNVVKKSIKHNGKAKKKKERKIAYMTKSLNIHQREGNKKINSNA